MQCWQLVAVVAACIELAVMLVVFGCAGDVPCGFGGVLEYAVCAGEYRATTLLAVGDGAAFGAGGELVEFPVVRYPGQAVCRAVGGISCM